ncbi:protein unc-13, partial [Tanacetum coccineum]
MGCCTVGDNGNAGEAGGMTAGVFSPSGPGWRLGSSFQTQHDGFNSHSSTMLPQGGLGGARLASPNIMLGGARPASPNIVTSAQQQQPLMSTGSKDNVQAEISNAKVDEMDQQQSLSDDAAPDSAQNVGLSKNAANKEDPKVAYASDMQGIQQLCESTAYKIAFHDLSHSLWDGLYVGELSSSAIEPFLHDLEQNLMVIADTLNERVRTHLVAEIMKASFEGFLMVLLAGGQSRAFTLQDSRQIEDDFKSFRDLFFANGDGLPMDVINNVTLETYGSSAKSRLPLPATTGQWSPSDPNTLLRVLCCRNDDAASKLRHRNHREFALSMLIYWFSGAYTGASSCKSAKAWQGICLKKSITSLRDRIASGLLLCMVSVTDTSEVLQVYTYVWGNSTDIDLYVDWDFK